MTKKKKTHNRLLQSQENWRLLIKYEGKKKKKLAALLGGV